MLTKKQHELLIFIFDRLGQDGVSPSFEEMKAALKLKSKSGIHRLITALEERGFVRRLPHRARALEVIKLPDSARSRFSPTVIQGNFKPALPGTATVSETESVQLPLYGRIAAGTPIEALRDHTKSVDIPASMLSPGAEHYALEVSGDSMVDAGVYDGDTVIVRATEHAENGTIVVALVDDSEVTLKRLRRKGASIALEPANQAYETRIFGPDRVKVQGRLVGLIRRY